MRRISPLLLCLLLAACTPSPGSRAGESSLPNEGESRPYSSEESSAGFEAAAFSLQEAFPNLRFEEPLYLTYAPGEEDSLYIVERTGRIYRISRNPDTDRKELFLDLSDIVQTQGQEQGLLGLAFHPDFSNTPHFYVNYTAQDQTYISRFTATADKAANPSTELVLLRFDQPFSNHNGGHLEFGPDGHLYIATGDGGSGGDPQNNAQNKNSLLGKILRLDIAPESSGIPEDNPFFEEADAAQEVYAYGLRNPWRFSFDSHTGALWAADVGQNAWEEINLIEKGGNYGWNRFEGSHPYLAKSEEEAADYIAPLYEYDHSQGRSITGGYVYRGEAFPGMQGLYIYGDFVSGRIWALELEEDGNVLNEEFMQTDLLISSFGQDQDGELYVLDFAGQIYQFSK